MPSPNYRDLVGKPEESVSQRRFPIGNFLCGFFLGPIGLFFVSNENSEKRSISATIIGWAVGWTLALLVVSVVSFWIVRREEVEKARIEAAQKLEAVKLQQEQERKKETEERAAMLARKRMSLQNLKELRADVCENRKYINSLLAGEVQEGFDSITIQKLGLSSRGGGPLVSVSYGEKLDEESSQEEIEDAPGLTHKKLP